MTFGKLLIKGVESSDACHHLKLGTKTWDNGVEFLLHLGILRLSPLIRWKALQGLVQCNEGVLDTKYELGTLQALKTLRKLKSNAEKPLVTS